MFLGRPNQVLWKTLSMRDYLGRNAEFEVFYQPRSLKSLHIVNSGVGYQYDSLQPFISAVIRVGDVNVDCLIRTNRAGEVLEISPPLGVSESDFLSLIRFTEKIGREFSIYQKSYISDLTSIPSYIRGEGARIVIRDFHFASQNPFQVIDGGSLYEASRTRVKVFRNYTTWDLYPIQMSVTVSNNQITGISLVSQNSGICFYDFPIIVIERFSQLYEVPANQMWIVKISPNKIPVEVNADGRSFFLTSENFYEMPIFAGDNFRISVYEDRYREGLVGLQGISRDTDIRIVIFSYTGSNVSRPPGLSLNSISF